MSAGIWVIQSSPKSGGELVHVSNLFVMMDLNMIQKVVNVSTLMSAPESCIHVKRRMFASTLKAATVAVHVFLDMSLMAVNVLMSMNALFKIMWISVVKVRVLTMLVHTLVTVTMDTRLITAHDVQLKI